MSSTDRPRQSAQPPAHVPTLTEVVTWPKSPPQAPSEAELVDRVLASLQRQVDLALEVKLRESLAPVLARASDAIVREAKRELSTTLRELVGRAIAEELARRGPG